MPIYCEDPRLSLEVPGLDYKASPLPEGFDPEPLTRNDLQLFIAFAASFLDISIALTGSTGSLGVSVGVFQGCFSVELRWTRCRTRGSLGPAVARYWKRLV